MKRRSMFRLMGAASVLALAESMGGPQRAAGQVEASRAGPDARPRIALTLDDPKTDLGPHMDWREANRRLLEALAERRLGAALFVCGMRVDDPEGTRLLGEWAEAGHLLGSHSYSHLMYLSRTSYEAFAADFERNEPVMARFPGRRRLFRYPLLKEGDTAEKRDRFRALLTDRGYANGAVTIDTSDWYVNTRLLQRLAERPDGDRAPYRDFYLAHLRERASFYRQLTLDVLGRDVTHTLLVHYTMLNALFLPDVLTAFEDAGWQWVDADRAFGDPIFQRAPRTLPAGESLIWALASEAGGLEDRLRWPGEDSAYEQPALDALGL